MGGFQGVPELFRTLEEWRKTQPADRDPWKPDTTGFEIVPVMPKAGDLLIFNSLLAHGIRPNTSKDKVRMAQYISMTPADESREDLREIRIRSWQEMEPPQGFAFPGDPREWEKKNCSPARADPARREAAGIEELELTEKCGRTPSAAGCLVEQSLAISPAVVQASLGCTVKAGGQECPAHTWNHGCNMTHGPIPGWRPPGLGGSGPVGAAASLFVLQATGSRKILRARARRHQRRRLPQSFSRIQLQACPTAGWIAPEKCRTIPPMPLPTLRSPASSRHL